MESEHSIQSNIMMALSKADCTVFRSNAGKVRTDDGRNIVLFPRGTPDLLGFRHSDGKMFFVEVKNQIGRLRPDQIRFAKFIRQYPVLYGVARSVDDALEIVGEYRD
ncbi:VRR-NUC domain-containing protein [Secundilactobacillus sp. HBUAS58055]|nr:VRR-NUC domain-containing protein [Secundilactobacillus angelensis]